MKSLFLLLQHYLRQATEAEKEILQYWLEHPEQSSRLNVREFEAVTYTSPSSIIRQCQKLYFKGNK